MHGESNRPRAAWRACKPTISTTSSAGPESWPMLMVTRLGGGAIQPALGLARGAQPAGMGVRVLAPARLAGRIAAPAAGRSSTD